MPAVESKARYSISVLAGGAGRLRVRSRDLHIDPLTEGRYPEDVIDSSLVYSSLLPSMVVSSRGELEALDRPEETVSMVRAAVLKAIQSENTRDAASGILPRLVTEPMIAGLANSQWLSLVSTLAGRSFEVGEKYSSKSSSPLPFTGDEIEMKVEFVLLGFAPCTESPNARRCVWLRSDAHPDERAMNDALRRAAPKLHEMIPATSGIELASIRLRFRTDLLTEPDSLLPHWYAQVKETTMVMRKQDGGEFTMESVERLRRGFHYKVSSAAPQPSTSGASK